MRALVIFLLFSVSCTFADSPAAPFAYIAAAEEGRYFVSLVPPYAKEPDWHIVLRKPYAAVFEPQPDGSFKELWRVNDFYSFQVFLTYDAKFMIAIGPWNTGDKPDKDDVALSFFQDGKLIQQFSTADLIDDPKAVSVSVSHYEWQDSKDQSFPRLRGKLFEVKTTEGRIISFGMDEGKITMNKNL